MVNIKKQPLKMIKLKKNYHLDHIHNPLSELKMYDETNNNNNNNTVLLINKIE